MSSCEYVISPCSKVPSCAYLALPCTYLVSLFFMSISKSNEEEPPPTLPARENCTDLMSSNCTPVASEFKKRMPHERHGLNDIPITV